MMYTNKPVKPTGMKAKPKKATGKTTGSLGLPLKKDTPKAKGGMKKNLPAYPGMSTGKLTKGPNYLGKNRKTPPGQKVKV